MNNNRVVPTYVSSSNIDAVGFRMGTLFLRFKSGVAYQYEKVPFSIYDALTKVESCGQFFHRMVKGKFHYTRLEVDPFAG
jgi:hypothetical protein